jgi:hypothetical protein
MSCFPPLALVTLFDGSATVLYDRPPSFFRPYSLEERHALFTREDFPAPGDHGQLTWLPVRVVAGTASMTWEEA